MNTVHLERPELFERTISQPSAAELGRLLLTSGQAAAKDADFQPNIAVLVRTKNDELGLERIMHQVENQQTTYQGRIDVVVVDTESQDGTRDVIRKYGGSLVTITQDEFSYPKGINRGLAHISDDVVATFITVGHAQPTLSNFLQAGARHFEDEAVTGAYGKVVAHENASIWERLVFSRSKRISAEAEQITEMAPGVFGATNCMIRMDTWRNHPFDERYAAGGEDTAWARSALERGEVIVRDPALAVHHSHGLGLVNFVKQMQHWREVSAEPQDFDTHRVSRRRPDLFS